MSPTILVDTGPLVALVDRRDRFHAWTKSRLTRVTPPLFSCEAVFSEACFLLRQVHGGPEAVLGLIERGLVRLDFDLNVEAAAVSRLLRRYASVPMALADACLVRMSELRSSVVVMTLDGDFRLYRRHGRQAIPVVLPERR